MNYRIPLGFMMFVLAGCVYSNGFLVKSNDRFAAAVIKASLVKEEFNTSDKPLNEVMTKESFLNLVYNLTQLGSINSSDRELWQKAGQHFPQIQHYRSHNLTVQYITYTDSIFLLFYEFEQKATNQGAMYLASYDTIGRQLNVIDLNNISFDGTIAVNLINKELIEIERHDFSVKENPFYLDTNDENADDQESLIPESQWIELASYDYYQIDGQGRFNYLTKINIPEDDRTFPQASSKILSKEELSLMGHHDLQMMRYEIYASYGYLFEEEIWFDYFSEKDWYNGQFQNIEQYLSAVERINVDNILAMETSF